VCHLGGDAKHAEQRRSQRVRVSSPSLLSLRFSSTGCSLSIISLVHPGFERTGPWTLNAQRQPNHALTTDLFVRSEGPGWRGARGGGRFGGIGEVQKDLQVRWDLERGTGRGKTNKRVGFVENQGNLHSRYVFIPLFPFLLPSPLSAFYLPSST
jgi:hypothetical protein